MRPWDKKPGRAYEGCAPNYARGSDPAGQGGVEVMRCYGNAFVGKEPETKYRGHSKSPRLYGDIGPGGEGGVQAVPWPRSAPRRSSTQPPSSSTQPIPASPSDQGGRSSRRPPGSSTQPVPSYPSDKPQSSRPSDQPPVQAYPQDVPPSTSRPNDRPNRGPSFDRPPGLGPGPGGSDATPNPHRCPDMARYPSPLPYPDYSYRSIRGRTFGATLLLPAMEVGSATHTLTRNKRKLRGRPG